MNNPVDLGMTVEEMHAYTSMHMAEGRHKCQMAMDRRGLHFLIKETDVRFCVPPDGKTHDDERVFIRAVF